MSRFPLDNIPISSLRIFCAVVDTQSYSLAASQMKISVSSTSKTVSALEKALGMALLLRTTRKVCITESGKQFYDHCMRILFEVDTASCNSLEGVKGHLRVSASPSISSEILGPTIETYHKANPSLTLDLFVTAAIPDMVKQRIDIALVLRKFPEVKMTNRLLSKMDRVLVASPGYIEELGSPETIEDLNNHRCLASLLNGEQEPWTFRIDDKQKIIRVNAVMAADNGNALRSASIKGMGIANLYTFHARKHLESGELIPILPDLPQEPVGLYAVLPHREIMRPPAIEFMEHLEKKMKIFSAVSN